MKKFFIFLIVIFILAGAVIFYLLQPKTLGIRYTAADLQSIKGKIKISNEPLPTNSPIGQTLIVSGSHPVDASFTSEELTAIADNRHKDYAYFPFRNVQIRVNNDGSVEGSATVNYQDAVNYLVSLGVSASDIAKGAAKFKIPNANLPVYLKVSGTISDNQSQINVQQAKIANISIPQNYITDYSPALNNLIDSIIQDRQPSVNINKLEVSGSQVHFKGTSPDVEKTVRSNKY